MMSGWGIADLMWRDCSYKAWRESKMKREWERGLGGKGSKEKGEWEESRERERESVSGVEQRGRGRDEGLRRGSYILWVFYCFFGLCTFVSPEHTPLGAESPSGHHPPLPQSGVAGTHKRSRSAMTLNTNCNTWQLWWSWRMILLSLVKSPRS